MIGYNSPKLAKFYGNMLSLSKTIAKSCFFWGGVLFHSHCTLAASRISCGSLLCKCFIVGDIQVRFYDSQWEDYAALTDDDVHRNVSRRLMQSLLLTQFVMKSHIFKSSTRSEKQKTIT